MMVIVNFLQMYLRYVPKFILTLQHHSWQRQEIIPKLLMSSMILDIDFTLVIDQQSEIGRAMHVTV